MMALGSLGTIGLATACGLSAWGAWSSVARLRGQSGAVVRWGERAVWAAGGVIWAMVAMLAVGCVTGRPATWYTMLHSADLSGRWRLASLWDGVEGTMLVWLALVWTVGAGVLGRRRGMTSTLGAMPAAWAMVLTLVLAVMVSLGDPFGAVRPEGTQGRELATDHSLWQSPVMGAAAIIGCAILTVAFVGCFGDLSDRHHRQTLATLGRWAWAWLSVSLVAGWVWRYYSQPETGAWGGSILTGAVVAAALCALGLAHARSCDDPDGGWTAFWAMGSMLAVGFWLIVLSGEPWTSEHRVELTSLRAVWAAMIVAGMIAMLSRLAGRTRHAAISSRQRHAVFLVPVAILAVQSAMSMSAVDAPSGSATTWLVLMALLFVCRTTRVSTSARARHECMVSSATLASVVTFALWRFGQPTIAALIGSWLATAVGVTVVFEMSSVRTHWRRRVATGLGHLGATVLTFGALAASGPYVRQTVMLAPGEKAAIPSGIVTMHRLEPLASMPVVGDAAKFAVRATLDVADSMGSQTMRLDAGWTAAGEPVNVARVFSPGWVQDTVVVLRDVHDGRATIEIVRYRMVWVMWAALVIWVVGAAIGMMAERTPTSETPAEESDESNGERVSHG